ncbi:hypothetical protein [Paenibacillus sp. ATY16]|uniref:hypothetical protein n=1 Tax=Paenibacillus sp. ATY16 TaxID=1759312 RepID=UPI00200EBCFD|nr:hypothetical protein [Paenibacillus sp. ATY16]MCK9862588.1 hypothetical protein [Paenibacillus sp. ATY16]
MEIRSIRESEIDLFIEVLMEGASWIAANKERMWDEADLQAHSLMEGLTINNFFAAFMDGEIAGVMILQDEDSFFWPEDPEGEALYRNKELCQRIALLLSIQLAVADQLPWKPFQYHLPSV